MPIFRTATLAATTLALAFAAAPARALKSDRDKPLDLAADSLETTEGQAQTTVRGNVRITQGTLEVESDSAVVYRGGGNAIGEPYTNGAPTFPRTSLTLRYDVGGTKNVSFTGQTNSGLTCAGSGQLTIQQIYY
jgi:lipopolysaccharide export system protein LptA